MNVHDQSISESTNRFLILLIETIKPKHSFDEIYEILIKRVSHKGEEKEKSEKLSKRFQRFRIETSKFQGISLPEILRLVYEKILTHQDSNTIIDRLIEEILDMDDLCASRHLSLMINSLSTYFNNVITISFSQQLKSNIVARFNKYLRSSSSKDSDAILLEMTGDGDKSTILEFIETYSCYDELLAEFVTDGNYMNKEEFDKVYDSTVSEYVGLNIDNANSKDSKSNNLKRKNDNE